jgi:hypothetical protein
MTELIWDVKYDAHGSKIAGEIIAAEAAASAARNQPST